MDIEKQLQIAQEVKRDLAGQGISVIQLAEIMGVSYQGVGQTLAGKRPIGAKFARRLSELYGYDANYLLTGEGSLRRIGTQSNGTDIVIPAALAQMFSDMAATIRSQQEQLREQAAAAAPKNRVEDNQRKIG